jgi:cytochrome c2
MIYMVRLSAVAVCMGMAASQLMGAAGDSGNGKKVFAQCAMCHAAETDQKKMGPALKGLFKRAKLANGKATDEASVRAIINDGGKGMPAYEKTLNAKQKDDLMAYLKTL